MIKYAKSPYAYLITWTTYGTWLPGDKRRWFSRKESGSLEPNQKLQSLAKEKMRSPPFLLTKKDRLLTEAIIQKVCHFRDWDLRAVNARSNHVHVVIEAIINKPERIGPQLKSWASRALKEVYKNRDRFWTKGCSCRHINNENSLGAAIIYVKESQDDPDRFQ